MFETVAAHGRLRVLVNNASYRPRQPVHEITEEDWRRVHSVTLDGAFRCIRCALPALSPGGRVVNILGRNALSGDSERVHVSAAKYGLLGLTLALAAALREDGWPSMPYRRALTAMAPSWAGAGPRSRRRSRGSPTRRLLSSPGPSFASTATGPGGQRPYGVVSASIASTSLVWMSEKVASASLAARSGPRTSSTSPWNLSLSSSSVSLLPGVPRA